MESMFQFIGRLSATGDGKGAGKSAGVTETGEQRVFIDQCNFL